jgi:hypothetical protein
MKKLPPNKHLAFFLILISACNSLAASGFNIAKIASITSRPFVGANIDYLVDGNINKHPSGSLMTSSPLPVLSNMVMPISYTFSFKKKYKIHGVSVFQHRSPGRQSAINYILEADTNNDGNFDKIIVHEKNGEGDKWFRYKTKNSITTNKIRFRTTGYRKTKGPSHGGAAIAEIEIYSYESPAQTTLTPTHKAPSLTLDENTQTYWDKHIFKKQDTDKNSFIRGTFASMWSFWSLGQKYSASDNIKLARRMTKLGINTLWLYPGIYVDPTKPTASLTTPSNNYYSHFSQKTSKAINGKIMRRIMPFPSKVAPGYSENILTKFIDNMHHYGIRVIINEKLVPFGAKSWGFPNVQEPDIFPNLLCSDFMRQASIQYYREFLESGVDGLALGGDEFFVYNQPSQRNRKPLICRTEQPELLDLCTPTCKTLFDRKFGSTMETDDTFSPTSKALWELFEYDLTADLISEHTTIMRNEYPGTTITSLFRPGEQNRVAYGIAYDIMGHKGGIDVMSSDPYWSHNHYLGHYYFANETKKLIGASKKGHASVTLQTSPTFNKNGYKNPLMLYGPAFSALMHGARGINFYKLDYLYSGGKPDSGQPVTNFFNMVKYLEQEGLLNYKTPRKFAVLYSRASDDWWQQQNQNDPAQSAKAIVYQNFIMDSLFRNGIPFDLFYIDQYESLSKISEYETLIIPFPYSISLDNANLIKKASNSGVRTITINKNGDVDEIGQKHNKPLLTNLKGQLHLNLDLKNATYKELSRKIIDAISKQTSSPLPLTFITDNSDVECTLRVNNNKRMIFCLNWDSKIADIQLGINMPKGEYKMKYINMESYASASIWDKTIISENDLKSFRINLKHGELVTLLIEPVTTH